MAVRRFPAKGYDLHILTPAHTYVALLVVQTMHLFHHRIVKRHISYAETISSLVLCFPPFLISLPAVVFMSAHIAMILVQLVGSVWIQKLSPDWDARSSITTEHSAPPVLGR